MGEGNIFTRGSGSITEGGRIGGTNSFTMGGTNTYVGYDEEDLVEEMDLSGEGKLSTGAASFRALKGVDKMSPKKKARSAFQSTLSRLI